MNSVSKQLPYAKHNLKTNVKQDNSGQRTFLKFLLRIICANLPKYRAHLSNSCVMVICFGFTLAVGSGCGVANLTVAHTILMYVVL